MDLQFRWSESDYLAAQYAWILHRPWLIIRGYWYSLLIFCMVTVGIVVKPAKWKIDILFMCGYCCGNAKLNHVALALAPAV